MSDRFIISFLGIIFGGIIMSIFYDINLAKIGIHCTNQLGTQTPLVGKFCALAIVGSCLTVIVIKGKN